MKDMAPEDRLSMICQLLSAGVLSKKQAKELLEDPTAPVCPGGNGHTGDTNCEQIDCVARYVMES